MGINFILQKQFADCKCQNGMSSNMVCIVFLPFRLASLRLGGIPRSFDDHVIVVGDAAGMIDPMTGIMVYNGLYISKPLD